MRDNLKSGKQVGTFLGYIKNQNTEDYIVDCVQPPLVEADKQLNILMQRLDKQAPTAEQF